MPKIITLVFVFLELFGVASCTPKVNPNIKVSPINYPANWNRKSFYISKNDPIIEWWKQFNDPQLNRYINDIVRFNFDLYAAIMRVQEERAFSIEAQSKIYPQIDINAKYAKYKLFATHATLPQQLLALGTKKTMEFFSPAFDASWEIDLWGKQRWNIIAAQENIEVANEYKRAVLISLVGELARNYMDLRGNQKQLVILKKNIANQNNKVKLIQSRYKIGLSKKIEVTDAQVLLKSMQSQLANIQSSIIVSAYSISVLTGRNPDALLKEVLPNKPLPCPVEVVAVGLPADLILRRPDIRQAQRVLGSAIALVGSAKADLYPAIGINGGIGFAKIQVGDLINLTSGLWSITPTINWKIFDRRILTAQFKANKAKAKIADAELRQTVLNAIKDVETSISNFESSKITKNELEQATSLSRQAYNMIKDAYKIGLKTHLDVLDAEDAYLNNQSKLAASKTQINLQIINLYKALGGGWQILSQKQ